MRHTTRNNSSDQLRGGTWRAVLAKHAPYVSSKNKGAESEKKRNRWSPSGSRSRSSWCHLALPRHSSQHAFIFAMSAFLSSWPLWQVLLVVKRLVNAARIQPARWLQEPCVLHRERPQGGAAISPISAPKFSANQISAHNLGSPNEAGLLLWYEIAKQTRFCAPDVHQCIVVEGQEDVLLHGTGKNTQ